MKALRLLFPFLRPHWQGYAGGLILVPFSVAALLGVPFLTGKCVQLLEGAQLGWSLGRLLAAITVVSLIGGLSLFAVRYWIIGASRRMEFDLRNHVFDHLQALDQSYFKHARTGDLMARMTSDIESARILAGPVIMYSVRTAILLVLALPLMISVSWILTLVVMAPLTLLTFSVRWIGPRTHRAALRSQEVLSELSSAAQENFAGVRVIKSYAQEEQEIASFSEVAVRYMERNMDVARMGALMHPIIGLVTDASLVVLLLAGGLLILGGQLQLHDIVAFAGYQSSLLWPMISIGWVVNQYHRASASIERLEGLLAVRPRVTEPAEPLLPPGGVVQGRLSIRGLTFAYPPPPGGASQNEVTVLEDISLEVPAGKTAAIVGRTGSGKSTLVSLIPRLFAAPAATIFVDGIDINRLPLAVLRRAIGFVPQESFLFSRTVEANIALGLDEWTREQVTAVAEVTRFHKDIDQLPRGYGELVGERGVTLSGGQKQRASMARALLLRPKILILDDALSAVDAQTENELVANLKRATENLTTLIVSHRVSSIRHADRIFVLDQGRIVEEGTHEELVRKGGLYAEMHQLQVISDELDRM